MAYMKLFKLIFLVLIQNGYGLKNIFSRTHKSYRAGTKISMTPNQLLDKVPGIFMLYKEFRGISEGILEDAIILGTLTTVSDVVAQIIEKRSPLCTNFQTTLSKLDQIRTRKFAIFGMIDGILSHSWYFALNKYIQGVEIFEIFKKILADTFREKAVRGL